MHKIRHNLSIVRKRQLRTRKKLFGTAVKPRICVFRSNKHLVVQAIDDASGQTIAGSSDMKFEKLKKTKLQKAQDVAIKLSELLKKSKIASAIFDRGAYKYHGRVKAVAESLRSNGIKI